jgi:hypothetical protein
MNIQVIHEHSVAIDLLTGGICIDVGCRGFGFSEAMRDLGCEVWAYDLEDFQAPDNIRYEKCAVCDYNGYSIIRRTNDPQGTYIQISGSGEEIKTISLFKIYLSTDKKIDILKLDCEGSEYFILSHENFAPVPRQISIEFHMHSQKPWHNEYYDKCMENLLKYYEPVQHELTQAHGAGENYWDSLFIRKDLL